jgi:hypothetical protein
VGNIPDFNDKLNKYYSGTARTNLHSLKNKLKILSGPGLVLFLRWSSSYIIYVKDKEHELKLTKDKSLLVRLCDAVIDRLKTLEKYL